MKASSAQRALEAAELAILNAPFREHGWEEAIHLAALACGADCANLVRFGGSLPSLSIITGDRADQAHRYLAESELWGRSNWRVATAMPRGTISFDPHYQQYRATTDTSPYDDAAFDLDMEFGCQTLLDEFAGGFVGLAVIRGRRQGRCTPEDIAQFKRLIVTAERAVRAERALAGEAADLSQGQLDSLNAPILLADRHGMIQAMSPAAETIVLEGRKARMRLSTFALIDHAENERFQSTMASLLRYDRREGFAGEIPLSGGRSIGIVQMPPVAAGLGFEPQLSITLKGDWQ